MILRNLNNGFLCHALALYFSVGMGWVMAHDNKTVHPALTAKAWNILPEVNRTAILDQLGVKKDQHLGFSVPDMTEIPTAVGIMVQGSIDEDAPDSRCLGHFYNPLAQNHALTKPAMGAPDSFEWATIGASIYAPVKGNEEDWSDVRHYHYNALTYNAQSDRLEKTAHTFYALGKIMHLLQDLSQPEHTRNDAHLINGGVLPKARIIENFGAIKGVSIVDNMTALSPFDWRNAGFKSVEDFWNRKKYTDGSQGSLDALNADANGDVTNALGLSEFSSGNFLGYDASYKELTSTTGSLHFPHPALADTNCPEAVSLLQLASTLDPLKTVDGAGGRQFIFLSKTKSGISVKHHSVLTYTGFKRLQLGRSIDPNAGGRLAEVTINSTSVLQEYHEILLKKAVEYSAGLLDYFFRGKLSADCYFDETSGKYHLLVSNVSGQPFHGGSFEVYFDDAAGNRTKYTGVTDDYSPQGDTRTLEAGYGVEGYGEWFKYGYYSWYEDLWFPCVRIEIPVPNSTAGLAATKAIVVYKEGIIGGKKTDGTAEDSVDEAKAVAAVHFDLPKIVAPIPGVEAISRSASKSKRGIPEYYGYQSTPPKIYRTIRYTNSLYVSGIAFAAFSGSRTLGTNSGYDYDTKSVIRPSDGYDYIRAGYFFATSNLTAGWNLSAGVSTSNNIISATENDVLFNGQPCGWSNNYCASESLSDEYTTSALITNTMADLPVYGSTWSGWSSASRDLPISELSYSIRESTYRFRFNPGSVPAGLGYRLSWVERFLPSLTYNSSGQITGGGSALNRIDVVDGGAGYKTATVDSYMDGTGGVVVYVTDGGNGYAVAPTVALPAPPAGSNGTQATAHAVVSNGTVTEIIMDNAGSGYTDAPVLTLAAPTGSANPVIVISAPGNGGTQATATATLNAAGQIQSISLNASGSRYTGTPYVYVSSSPNGLGQGATFAVHLGTETEKTATWSGPVPGNYSAADSSTWPVIGPYDLTVPVTNGTTTVENVKAEITAGP